MVDPMKLRIALFLAFAVWCLMLLAREALAETCGPYDGVSEGLRTGYGETPRFHGLTEGSGALMVVTLNEDSGSWTVLMVRPDGFACMVAAGSVGALVKAPPEGVPG